MAKPCEHLQDLTAADFPPPRTPGACEECLKEGTRWVELRECQACGHVGCCDSSPGKHATNRQLISVRDGRGLRSAWLTSEK